jgi:hypothetical protein
VFAAAQRRCACTFVCHRFCMMFNADLDSASAGALQASNRAAQACAVKLFSSCLNHEASCATTAAAAGHFCKALASHADTVTAA